MARQQERRNVEVLNETGDPDIEESNSFGPGDKMAPKGVE